MNFSVNHCRTNYGENSHKEHASNVYFLTCYTSVFCLCLSTHCGLNATCGMVGHKNDPFRIYFDFWSSWVDEIGWFWANKAHNRCPLVSCKRLNLQVSQVVGLQVHFHRTLNCYAHCNFRSRNRTSTLPPAAKHHNYHTSRCKYKSNQLTGLICITWLLC